MADSTNVISDFQFIAGSVIFASLAVILFVLFNRKSSQSEPETQNGDNESIQKQQLQQNQQESGGGKTSGGNGKKNKKAGHDKQKKEQKAAYGHRWLLTTLKGHSGTVLNLDFSGNGKYLASCADGGNLYWKGGGGNGGAGNPCNNQSRRQQVKKNKQPIVNNNNNNNKQADDMAFCNPAWPFPLHNIPMELYNKRIREFNAKNSYNSSVYEPIPVFKTNYMWPIYGARPPLEVYCAFAREGLELYKQLTNYVLTRDQRQEWGYPVQCAETGKIVVKNPPPRPKEDVPEKLKLKPEERVCCRCSSRFIVSEDGVYGANDTCSYHWGKFKAVDCNRFENKSNAASVYSCCAGSVNSRGCTFSKFHVSQQPNADVSQNFVKTRNKKTNNSRKNGADTLVGDGIYALDCEMCYTFAGLEVTKVTVVGPEGYVIYDSLVLPEYPILDYNTAFSGITANDMKNVSTTLDDVHAVLLKLFNSNTILIGHGLENDLKALRLLHETIIDTSVIFPHYFGLPYRRSLKSLVTCYLQKSIQNSPLGHDSAEDARACMELMLWKVLQDRQRMQQANNGKII